MGGGRQEAGCLPGGAYTLLAHTVVVEGFVSRYGLYKRKQNVLSVSLNKIFPFHFFLLRVVNLHFLFS